MEIQYRPDAVRFLRMMTQEIRSSFLIESLLKPDMIEMIYIDVDHVIVGSAVPVQCALSLTSASQLRAGAFCQRRDMGILNVGSAGAITVDQRCYPMSNLAR